MAKSLYNRVLVVWRVDQSVALLGLLGVLVQAKRQGHLAALTPVLRELDEIAGFYVGGDLRREVLASVGEAEAS